MLVAKALAVTLANVCRAGAVCPGTPVGPDELETIKIILIKFLNSFQTRNSVALTGLALGNSCADKSKKKFHTLVASLCYFALCYQTQTVLQFYPKSEDHLIAA